MSLDVYLTTQEKRIRESSGIFIRENGSTIEISEDEWKERNPGQTPVKIEQIPETNEVYSANITHNLGKMAEKAGIYYVLWRPEEIGISKAEQLIEPLKNGLQLLKDDPQSFKELNPSNGWGTYEGLVTFVENYLNACIDYPNADVSASC